MASRWSDARCYWVNRPHCEILLGSCLRKLSKWRLDVIGWIHNWARTLQPSLAGTRVANVDSSWNVLAHGDARERNWRRNWRMEWVASTLHTTSQHCVSSITTADAHTSAASSRLNWRPCRFKWTRPFCRKTKSGFCACAITFQLTCTATGTCDESQQWLWRNGRTYVDTVQVRMRQWEWCWYRGGDKPWLIKRPEYAVASTVHFGVPLFG